MMLLPKAGVAALTVAYLLRASGMQVGLTVSAPNTQVVLGEPIIASLIVKNESLNPLIIYPDDPEFLRVIVGDSKGEEVHTTRLNRPDPGGHFGYDVQPGHERTERIALTQIAHLPAPGAYTVTVSIPAFQVTAPRLTVVVTPYDRRALDSWARNTTREIFAVQMADGLVLTKALAGIPGEISSPYACRLLTEKQAWAIPDAVDMLEQTGTIDAARCLIQSLPRYKGSEKDYIESALARIRKSTVSPQNINEIDATIGHK